MDAAEPPISDAAEDLARDRRRWALPGSRWDRFAGVMRWFLPALAMIILLTGLIWPLTQDREFSFILSKDEVEMAGDRMRLGEAVYRGEDDEGRAFEIRAARGVQETSANPRVVLSDLSARLDMAEGLATVSAPRGIYNLDTERLRVAGPVRVNRLDGYRLITGDVTVDLPSRSLKSTGRIEGQLPLGNFAADSLSADLETRRVVLDGNSRMRINP